jgi:predicted benzoate:H+ symporter BenE
VSAAFWGLVFGALASALLERDDYRALRAAA